MKKTNATPLNGAQEEEFIEVFGAKEHNLKNVDISIAKLASITAINYSEVSVSQPITFTLINATTDGDIQALKEGDVLDLNQLPAVRFNVRANTTPAKVGSVVFQLSGPFSRKATESGAPYALFGDENGNYKGASLPTGDYTLTATTYSKSGGKGTKEATATIHFKVSYTSAITRLVLTNAKNGKDIQEINEGDVINLSTLPTQSISVRAYTSPTPVGSVLFDLSGQQSHHFTENLAPYALFGGSTKADNPWAVQPGSYTLTATPYSAKEGYGAKGNGKTVHFTVINGTAPAITMRDGTGSTGGSTEGIKQVQFGAAPNPFVNTTRLQYSLSTKAMVNIKLYDVMGREVSTVFNGQRSAGTFWQDYNTQKLVSGVYYCRLVTTIDGKETVQTIKLVKAE